MSKTKNQTLRRKAKQYSKIKQNEATSVNELSAT